MQLVTSRFNFEVHDNQQNLISKIEFFATVPLFNCKKLAFNKFHRYIQKIDGNVFLLVDKSEIFDH